MASFLAFLVAAKQWVQLAIAALGFGRQVADTIQTHEDIEAGRRAGQAETEAAQAQQGAAAEAAIADEAAKPVTEDDAIARMKRGDA